MTHSIPLDDIAWLLLGIAGLLIATDAADGDVTPGYEAAGCISFSVGAVMVAIAIAGLLA